MGLGETFPGVSSEKSIILNELAPILLGRDATEIEALCANSEIISEGLNGRCEACGGQALLRLKGVLGETIDSQSSFTLVPSLVANAVRLGQLAASAA